MNIVQNNNQYKFYNNINILDRLEKGVYLLKYDMFGIFLSKTEDFTLPDKIYDVEKDFRDIILKSYNYHTRNTGVLLEGYKGQGKTITAKQLCIESELPVIMIDSSIPTNIDFITFLNEIKQEFVIFIDEFEKIFKCYDGENPENGSYHLQESLLTITDGALSNDHKKLFIFTCNNSINNKFINRPSRIRFHKKYNYMNKKLYNLVLDDLLENKEYKEDLLQNLPIGTCTVDLLISIIKEINILEKPYSEFKKIFNHSEDKTEYTVFILKNDKFIKLGTSIEDSCITQESSYLSGLNIDRFINCDENCSIFVSQGHHSLLYNIDPKNTLKGPYTYKYEKKVLVNSLAF